MPTAYHASPTCWPLPLLPPLDIDLGRRGDPRQPVTDALQQRGLHINKATITRVRSGVSPPGRTAYRLACADLLRADDASAKTQYCLQVLSVGREARRPNAAPHRLYATWGLTPAMQAALGCPYDLLTDVLRIMRADLALWAAHTPREVMRSEAKSLPRGRRGDLVARFRETASWFLRVQGPLNWRVLHGVTDLIAIAWDHLTIPSFYCTLYSLAGTSTRAAWLPYELDLLQSFYLRQQALGDHLTPLDRQVLSSAAVRTPRAAELVSLVQSQVGVLYDRACTTTHRRLLVAGSLTPPKTSSEGVEGFIPLGGLSGSLIAPRSTVPILDPCGKVVHDTLG